MKNRWKKALLMGALVVLVIAVGAVVVLAQNGGAAPDDEPAVTAVRGHWRGYHSDLGYHQEDLAAVLGITLEELEAAQREAKMMQIERAVDEGNLSMEQGNLMLAMVALKGAVDKHVLLAAALDMDVEELDAAIEDGSLHDRLAEVAPADLQAGLQEAFEAALQQAIDDMLITEEQAQQVRDQLGDGLGFKYHHHGFGRHGRRMPGQNFSSRWGSPPAQSSSLPTFNSF
ncbi:MAG: hypothetical protein R3293_21755 [Candidatus Promineifilaceae bacterium]|nr:hypothetical protein [Candidatus Promineifilaceae bacterium]